MNLLDNAELHEAHERYENALSPETFAIQADLARANNFDVIEADEYTLLLDLDAPEALAQFEHVFPILERHFIVVKQETWKSKSGHTHKLLELAKPLSVMERLLLQAALGSDGRREVIALVRLHNGVANPSRLFKPKS